MASHANQYGGTRGAIEHYAACLTTGTTTPRVLSVLSAGREDARGSVAGAEVVRRRLHLHLAAKMAFYSWSCLR